MYSNLSAYEKIVGSREIEEILTLADKIKGISVVHVNSTFEGGGVAEILRSLVPLFNLAGIHCRWEVIRGTDKFFRTTKFFHNLLQGISFEGKDKISIPEEMLDEYRRVNEENIKKIDLTSDIVIVHDPQPAALIKAKKDNKWVWRCHIDLSNPDRKTWNYLSSYIKEYDAAVFSLEDFVQSLPLACYIIPPSIDPLNEKNKELSSDDIKRVLKRLKIPQEKPILLQVSRFDYFKDPVGVIKMYRMVKKKVDCQLILAGGEAKDDPEGPEVLTRVREEAGDDPDIHILNLPPESFFEINALQRSAEVVIQKSLKEGFGLTVTEALWKARPVVGGNVGGIRLQIMQGKNGFLVSSPEEAAEKVEYLLKNPSVACKMGKAGKRLVKDKFLITRHLKDYLRMMTEILN